MLKRIFISVVLTYLSFSKSLAQDSDFFENKYINGETIYPIEKNYISSSQIVFSDQKIFVQTSSDLIEINSLESDDFGIYFKTEYPQLWECKCDEYNRDTAFCERCGKATPKPEYMPKDPHKYSYPPKKRR